MLDDDPTGTRSAGGVRVPPRWDAARLTETLRAVDSVYLRTTCDHHLARGSAEPFIGPSGL
ncbi:hypothetical protein [Streptosporangium sp. CA-115845]|uniref:hypothetical protein n=1 Tax=Streptosporangium sp. CA-115845 TaxID=3240071 RepID=UPI003D8B112F